jgi:hypothetical protein
MTRPARRAGHSHPTAAHYDAELLLAAVEDLPNPAGGHAAAMGRLVEELQRCAAANRARADRTEAILAEVLEMLGGQDLS